MRPPKIYFFIIDSSREIWGSDTNLENWFAAQLSIRSYRHHQDFRGIFFFAELSFCFLTVVVVFSNFFCGKQPHPLFLFCTAALQLTKEELAANVDILGEWRDHIPNFFFIGAAAGCS
jgi:hypothetical protein